VIDRLEDLDRAWRGAWSPPERLLPSQWAERYRILPAGVSAEPGRWSNSRTPYCVGIIDAITEPGVEFITYVSGTQVGKSEMLRNLLGYWIDNDPGPCLIVMPDEKSAKETIEERIKPMLYASPQLRRHVSERSWDTKQSAIKLDTMSIYVGWAGSPQSLASRPCRYVLLDEVDKYPPFSGSEADPISLAVERTTTYGHRRRVVMPSTPTNREGAIWRSMESAGDVRHYEVPCPHCGKAQRLVWPQIRWPKSDEQDKHKAADAIESGRLAWYECLECKEPILDRHKPKMLEAGKWRGEGRATKHLAFHLSGIYSPWRTFSQIAAEFVRAKGDPGRTMNFRNSWLAEPFEEVATKIRPSVVREKAASKSCPPPKQVPPWARLLLATADTQKDHFYWTVRAWGAGMRTQLVHMGIAYSFDELAKETLLTHFAGATPTALLIDSGGSRTDEVYEFAAKDPERIIPTKGSSLALKAPWHTFKVGSVGILARMIDPGFYKDVLSRLINDPDPLRWMPHAAVLEDYCLQMASEHKIFDAKNSRLIWTTVTTSAANHWWDCEVLQCAGADMAGIPAMVDEAAPAPRSNPGGEPSMIRSYAGKW
jgi:phage terminase large subunit GpA-like protein